MIANTSMIYILPFLQENYYIDFKVFADDVQGIFDKTLVNITISRGGPYNQPKESTNFMDPTGHYERALKLTVR